MSKKGFKYQGKHWTQLPENRERLIKMNTRTGKKKGKRRPKQHVVTQQILSKAEKLVRRTHKAKPAPVEEPSIVLNGWRVVLGHGTIRIEVAS